MAAVAVTVRPGGLVLYRSGTARPRTAATRIYTVTSGQHPVADRRHGISRFLFSVSLATSLYPLSSLPLPHSLTLSPSLSPLSLHPNQSFRGNTARSLRAHVLPFTAEARLVSPPGLVSTDS